MALEQMTYRAFADSYGVSVGSIRKRVNVEVSLAGRVGPSTVLTIEEDSLEGALE